MDSIRVALRVVMIADLPEPGEVIDGGEQSVTSYLVQALGPLSDVELHVIRLRRGVASPRKFELGDHTLHVLPMSRLGTLTCFEQDQRRLNRYIAGIQPDIVHSQGAGQYGILAVRTGYPSIITIHGILSEEARFEASLRARVRKTVQARMSHYWCIRRARHTILISKYVGDHFGEALVGEKYLVPNPVDDRFFSIRRIDTGRKILYAGRVRKLKGVTDLLRAVARLPSRDDMEVVLAGSLAEAGYVNEVRSLCARLGIEDNVKLPGLLDTEQLMRELAECACLVLPSYQENAPMVVQEAMAAGVPVVATQVGGVPFQVEDGGTGYLFAPGDVAALTGHLDRLISSAELRDRLGRTARSYAAERYRAASVAAQTVEVYRQVVGAVRDGQRETA